MSTMTMETNAAFSNVIGQELAKERLSYQLAAAENGRELKSSMITGRTGLGKNHLTDATANAYGAMGWKVYNFGCPSEMTGKVFAQMSEDIGTDGLPVCIKISEVHRLATIARVQLRRMHSFIMSFTDERRKGTHISINDGEIAALVDWTRLVFIMDTNFPGKLEEGKESTSFVDRLLHIKLEDYDRNQLAEILSRMLDAKGLRVHESTIRLMIDCARGTARPLQNITDELYSMAKALGDKVTLNREQVIQAIKLAKLFPLGLTHEEISILKHCRSPKRQVALNSFLPNLDAVAVRKSLAFLQGVTVPTKDEPVPFIQHTTSGFLTTTDGAKFLGNVVRDGFAI